MLWQPKEKADFWKFLDVFLLSLSVHFICEASDQWSRHWSHLAYTAGILQMIAVLRNTSLNTRYVSVHKFEKLQ